MTIEPRVQQRIVDDLTRFLESQRVLFPKLAPLLQCTEYNTAGTLTAWVRTSETTLYADLDLRNFHRVEQLAPLKRDIFQQLWNLDVAGASVPAFYRAQPDEHAGVL